MLLFYIEEDEIKHFMNKLLKETVFDKFEVRNIELETIVKYEILGNINKDYIEDKDRDFIKWSEIKPYVIELIKGKIRPKSLKIVFSLEKDALEKLAENASAMFLNFSYSNGEAFFTTGTSQKSFSLSKMEDKIWEDSILKFFKKNSINILIK